MAKHNNEKPAAKKSKKDILAIVTYAIVLLCLLAGLLIPFAPTGAIKDGFKTDNMLLMQLPAALNGLLGKDLIKFGAKEFNFSYQLDLFGLLKDGKTFDLGALLCLLYAVITVAALIGLIPVIAGKKENRTAIKTASVIEILAGIVLTLLFLTNLTVYMTAKIGEALTGEGVMNISYALLIAFGGTLLMLIVQSIGSKKGSGVIKTLLVLLSGIALFFLMFPVAGYYDKVATWMDGKLAKGLYGEGGYTYLTLFTFLCAFAGYKSGFTAEGATAADKTVLVLTTIIAIVLIINFILDLAGLGKKTKRFMLISNLARYSLQLAAVIALVVTAAVDKNYSIEILMYVLIGIAAVQLLINIIRFCAYKDEKTKAKNENEKVAKTAKADRKAEKAAAAEARRAEKAAKKAEKAAQAQVAAEAAEAAEAEKIAKKNKQAQPALAAEQPAVYEVKAIYDGPVDEFIKKLTTAERIEFANAFIEHNIILPNVPDYVVGGKNQKFFTSVFIYYARIREHISDGLLNKLYEQGNMMY